MKVALIVFFRGVHVVSFSGCWCSAPTEKSTQAHGLSPLCSDSSSGSEEEAGPGDDMTGMEHWMSRPSQLGPAHLGSTSSSSSSTQSGGSGNAGRLADSLAHTHIAHLAHLGHPHLGQSHHQQSLLSQSHHGENVSL
ncbi:hypothetical protein CCH79_00003945 [Gambusia affinis]|uniref:OAR domain-containing protein n=1 Tax=Gambusia affinis TaxID=33528 RepID=A0A315V477_GAMAF|nr:hypothetical protein CCH79_00003945 [Gambusia affinis]